MAARLVGDPRCLGAIAFAWATAVPCLADERHPAAVHGEAFLPQLFVQFKGGEDERDFAGAAGYGFDGVRIGLRWELVTRNSEDDWSYLDRATELADRHGLAVLITVRGGNPAYGPIVEHFTASVNRAEKLPAAPFSPAARAGFARFAAAAVSRAGARHPRLKLLWEIWNEPDFSRFWPPQPDAAAAGTLVATACPAMRAAGAAYVVAPAFGRRESLVAPGDFVRAFTAAGGLVCPDAVSVHPYWARPPEAFVDEHALIRSLGPQATRITELRIAIVGMAAILIMLIPNETYHILQGARDASVTYLKYTSPHVVRTLIESPFPPTGLLNFLLNYMYAFLVCVFPLLIDRTPKELILIIFNLACAFLLVVGLRSKNHAACSLSRLFLAHFIVLLLFEPDLGSYLRHLSNAVLYLVSSMLALEKPDADDLRPGRPVWARADSHRRPESRRACALAGDACSPDGGGAAWRAG
jgi:hypothetical protein